MSSQELNHYQQQLDAEIAKRKPQHADAVAEQDDADLHRNAPKPDQACLYGLIGDVARAGSSQTEANAFAIAAGFLTYLSAAVGRGPFIPVGNTRHHANVFSMHVGRSGRGRKGDALGLVHRIAYAVRQQSEHLAPQIHRGGLSTREGLALLIHDGWDEGKKTEVPPINDKRLFVVESEFANVLHQARRDGNTLSAALRDAWDGVSIKPATKTARVWATDPHVSVSGAITPNELRELMHTRELSNGFANRFLIFWSEADKVVPFPVATPQPEVDAFANRVCDVLQFAGADRHTDKDTLQLQLSPEARKIYERLYHGELRDISAGERITGMLERRAPMLLRLSVLFALTDKTLVVTQDHIKAALAWIRYGVDSVKFIFQSAVDEVGAAEVSEIGERIVSYLAEHGRTQRSGLTRNCFSGHISKEKIDHALDELLSANPPLIEVETVPRPKGQPGCATKFYRLPANCANSAKCGDDASDSQGFDVLRTVRNVRNVDAVESVPDDSNAPEFATIRTIREEQKAAQTRMNADSSHNSHISQPTQHFADEADEDTEVF